MPTHDDVGPERRARLAATRLYLVCDSKPGGRELAGVLRAAIAGGVDIVQLRDKRLSDEELTVVARTASALCGDLGALLIVNDRPHVAIDAGADGVHVGQEDAPVAQVRELVGEDMLVGLSTHTRAEIDRVRELVGNSGAEVADVDYIGVGPLHAKPGRPATGPSLVKHATLAATVPFFAIGGIHAGNLAVVLAAGARRVAVVRAIADAPNPEHAARTLRTILDGAPAAVCHSRPVR
jgi:thiamine-phosphate pyrophosphorylase